MKPRSGPRPPAASWKLHEAKARFSELFRQVLRDGPQRVEKQGGDAVVIVPAADFDRISARSAQPDRLSDFFRAAPTGGNALAVPRKRDHTRRVAW